MIPHPVYKLVHLLGVFMIVTSLAGLIFHNIVAGGAKTAAWKRAIAIHHGIGMALALVGGFGMMARLGIHWPWPGWIAGKFAIWLTLGLSLALVRRKREWSRAYWWLLPFLAISAAFLAIFKPAA